MTESIQGLGPDGRFVLMGFEAKPLTLSPGDVIIWCGRSIEIIGKPGVGFALFLPPPFVTLLHKNKT